MLPIAVAAVVLVAATVTGGLGLASASTKGHHRHKHPRAGTTASPTPSAVPSAPASAQPSASAAPATSTGTGAATPTTKTLLQEQWGGATSPGFDIWQRGGSTVTSGAADADAVDGKAVRLNLAANPQTSPSGAAEVSTKTSYQYGTFETREKAADCSGQPKAGVVTGIFTFANDGRDHDGDGVTDNSEIDIEILCAQPEVINLTIWTDYVDGGAQRRVSRIVNVKTGQISNTCYHESFDDCHALSGAEAQPATIAAHPSFNSATAYHEYGFTWSATGVRFWVGVDGAPVTLWDYRGPGQRIPHQPSEYLHNIWHTADWAPTNDRSAVQRPTARMTACVDWSRVSA